MNKETEKKIELTATTTTISFMGSIMINLLDEILCNVRIISLSTLKDPPKNSKDLKRRFGALEKAALLSKERLRMIEEAKKNGVKF